MAIISKRIVYDDNGAQLRTVVYGYTTQDNVEHLVGPVFLDSATANPASDMANREAGLWQALVDEDVNEIIEQIKDKHLIRLKKAGKNPKVIKRRYATNTHLFTKLLKWWMDAPTMEAQALIPAIDGITNAELRQFMPGIKGPQIAKIKARVNRLRPINDAIIADGGV